MLLDIRELKVSFSKRLIKHTIIDNLSFQVGYGKTVGLVGESGCGKSMTSLSIMRLLAPSCYIESGSIYFEGVDLLSLNDRQMRQVREKNISLIFQEPKVSLNPLYTIGNQLVETLKVSKHISKKEAMSASLEILRKVNMPDPEDKLSSYPHELSGGMCQRVLIAMALICKPKLLIADEPTTALDVTIQAQILQLLKDLQQQNKMSILFVTHDLAVVSEFCDDIIVMYAGKVVEKGTCADVLMKPKHPYTKGLLEAIPKFGQKRTKLSTIEGSVPSLGKMPTGCRFHPRCQFRLKKCAQEDPILSEVKHSHWSACFLN